MTKRNADRLVEDICRSIRHYDKDVLISTMVQVLTPRYMYVMSSFYGLNESRNSKSETLKDIADALNISPARARQIKESGLRKMRNVSNKYLL